MTKEDFHKIIQKPKNQCDGLELHLRHLWENNNSKSIFNITGLDFSSMLTGTNTSGIQIKNPTFL